jgi:GT2 family glycosyltransferase
LVSVVVVNFNGLQLTRACIKALLGQTYQPIEIIVVDNGSEVDEAALIGMDIAASSTSPDIRTLRLERNLGFSGGVNWGVSMARGEFITLVNNDSIPDSECIKKLIYALRKSGAAAVSGRLVNVSSPDEAATALRTPTWSKTSQRRRGMSRPRSARRIAAQSGLTPTATAHDAHSEPACFYPSGGLCCMTRRRSNHYCRNFADYFAYHEDSALGFALRLRGFKIVKEPAATAVHIEGSTSRRLGGLRLRYLQERNRWRNILTFYPAGVIVALWPLLSLQSLITCISLLPARPHEALGLLGAHIWLLTHLLAVLKRRRATRAMRRFPGAHDSASAVQDSPWLRELSCRTRRGKVPDAISFAWCKLFGVPCRELP